jgi:hypothetical protein
MRLRQPSITGALLVGMIVTAAVGHAQKGPETFTATATVKTSAGASATAPVRIVIDRIMPQSEADKYAAAFRKGGAAELRKALTGVKPTGSVVVGSQPSTPTRITFERRTDKGRLITIVTDKPILFLGAGAPGAKPKEGYDFAVIDLEVSDQGRGSGVMSPAAKIGLKETAFVVTDYSIELVQLKDVAKVAK